MEANNIIKAIKNIKEDCKYREFDESVPEVATYIDCNKFYNRVMGLVELLNSESEIKIGMTVYHNSVYDGREPLVVVGIRENQIELEGDYSGGTHPVTQKDWLSRAGVLFKKNNG